MFYIRPLTPGTVQNSSSWVYSKLVLKFNINHANRIMISATFIALWSLSVRRTAYTVMHPQCSQCTSPGLCRQLAQPGPLHGTRAFFRIRGRKTANNIQIKQQKSLRTCRKSSIIIAGISLHKITPNKVHNSYDERQIL